MSTRSTFTAAGQKSEAVGRGPIFYRLNCTSLSVGTVNYYFGKGTNSTDPRNLLILSGTWTGSVVIEFTTTPAVEASWEAVPNETYTANNARFING